MRQQDWDHLSDRLKNMLTNVFHADKDTAVFIGYKYEVFKVPLGLPHEGETLLVRVIDGAAGLLSPALGNTLTQECLQAEGEAKNACDMKNQIDRVGHRWSAVCD